MKTKEDWIAAAEALRLLKPVFGSEYEAKLTICRRAHAGLIRAHAERFMIDDKSAGPRNLPKEFWWAEGHQALEQNWTSGDFETWIKQRTRLRAFSVSFSRADIEELMPAKPEALSALKADSGTGYDGTMEWDVFISHATEDKEDFVRALAESLRRSGLSVWYDDFTLKVGDSLLQSIDSGLANSRHGIVVISPNFLNKKWPKKELAGLVAREALILPIWHNIGVDQVRSYSPTLADLKAVSSSEGIDEVTKQLMHAIGKGDAKASQIAAGPLAQLYRGRPLRFVQAEQQSFWGPCKKGDEPGTQVAGHWHVTNTTDREVVLLRVRLDSHTSTFSNVATEGLKDRLYSSTYPLPAHRMGKVTANLMFYPPIMSGTEPLVADVIFTDNYEEEHRTRSTFRFVRA